MIAYNFISYMAYSTVSLVLVITLLLIVRKIFGRWMSAKHRYYLWLILLIKLIVPFTPKWSAFSIDGWISKRLTDNPGTVIDKVSSNLSTVSILDNAKDYSVSVNTSWFDALSNALCILWAIVGLGILALVIINGLKFKSEIIENGYKPDYKLTTIIESCKTQLRVRNHKFKSLIIKGNYGAFVVGSIKPYMVISEDLYNELNDEEIKYVLLHEIVHLKRKDILIKMIMMVFCCIYWFNPMMWIARYIMMNDMELSCDENVLDSLNRNEVLSYGKTILKVIDKFSLNRHDGIIANVHGSKKNVIKRITSIASFSENGLNKKIFSLIIITFTLMATVAFAGVSSPYSDNIYENIGSSVTYKDFSYAFNGHTGTFVIYDEQHDQYTVFNKEGSEKRVSPCSTYKIAIALIGLEEGVISSTENNISWDGTKHSYSEWNTDQNLDTAMKYSVNWYFDKIDKSITRKSIQNYLSSLDYGNKNIGSLYSQYWNQSSLKVSAIEQVQFLEKIWDQDAGFKKENIEAIKNSMKLIEQDGVVLYGKTGSGSENDKAVNGWFIGVIEKDDSNYYFAVNLEGDDYVDGNKAKSIALDILKSNNYIK